MTNTHPQITPTNSNAPVAVYKPSEILEIIASYFSQQDAAPLAHLVQDLARSPLRMYNADQKR